MLDEVRYVRAAVGAINMNPIALACVDGRLLRSRLLYLTHHFVQAIPSEDLSKLFDTDFQLIKGPSESGPIVQYHHDSVSFGSEELHQSCQLIRINPSVEIVVNRHMVWEGLIGLLDAGNFRVSIVLVAVFGETRQVHQHSCLDHRVMCCVRCEVNSGLQKVNMFFSLDLRDDTTHL